MKRPPLPEAPYTGGCLCGAVRYIYKARPLALNACHCSDCKKLSGSSFFAVVQAKGDAFTFIGDITHHRKTADSGRQVDIHRCVACGTRLWHTPSGSTTLVFFGAGTLDDPTWFVPTSHIWAARAQPDVAFAPDALIFDGAPADRQPIWDRFNLIYPPSA
jgi:hypothetical protein